MTDVRHDGGRAGRRPDAGPGLDQDLDAVLARWGSAQDGPFRVGRPAAPEPGRPPPRQPDAAARSRSAPSGGDPAWADRPYPARPPAGHPGPGSGYGGGWRAAPSNGPPPPGRRCGRSAALGSRRRGHGAEPGPRLPWRHRRRRPRCQGDSLPGWAAARQGPPSSVRQGGQPPGGPAAREGPPTPFARVDSRPRGCRSGGPADAVRGPEPGLARRPRPAAGPAGAAAGAYAGWLGSGTGRTGAAVLERPAADGHDLLTHGLGRGLGPRPARTSTGTSAAATSRTRGPATTTRRRPGRPVAGTGSPPAGRAGCASSAGSAPSSASSSSPAAVSGCTSTTSCPATSAASTRCPRTTRPSGTPPSSSTRRTT